MSELDDLRRRVAALEGQVGELRETHTESRRAADLFALVDRDVADLGAAFGAQRQVLQALRDTQLEQGQVLGAHGDVLASHSQVLADHSRVLAEHGQILSGHTQTLAGHSQALDAILAQLQEHGRILNRLDPGEP